MNFTAEDNVRYIQQRLDEALACVNLSEAWYESYTYWLWWLDTFDSNLANEYLGKGGDAERSITNTQQSTDGLLSELAKGGAVFQEVYGYFVRTNLENAPVASGVEQSHFKQPEFADKMAKIVSALYAAKVFADDMIIYVAPNLGNLMRQASYYIIEIPRINCQIAVCDQIGEISFFSREIQSINFWAEMSKDELKEHPAIGTFKYNRSNPAWGVDFVANMLSPENAAKIEPAKTTKIRLGRSSTVLVTATKLTEWVEIYHEKEGRYPSIESAAVYERDGVDDDGKPKYKEVKGITWRALNKRLINGKIEGATEKALAEFKQARGFVGDVNAAKLVEWIEIYNEKEGRYPSAESAAVYERDGVDDDGKPKYKEVKGITWIALNMRLINGKIEGATETTLSAFVDKSQGLVGKVNAARLAEWIKTYHEKEGRYPSIESAAVYERDGVDDKGAPKYKKVSGITWLALNKRLINGKIEGATEKALAEFKQARGFVDGVTATQLAEWIKTYHEKEGSYPCNKSAAVYERDGVDDKGAPKYKKVSGITWLALNKRLINGKIEGATEKALAEFKQARGFVDGVTATQLAEWIKTYHEKEGSYPCNKSGAVYERDGVDDDSKPKYKQVNGITWEALGGRLSRGSIEGATQKTLAEFKQACGLFDARDLRQRKRHPRVAGGGNKEAGRQ